MTDLIWLSPVALFLFGALLASAVPRPWAPWISLLTPIVSAVLACWLIYGSDASRPQTLVLEVMDYTLNPVSLDRLGILMVGLFHGAALVGALFIHSIKDRLQHSALIAYFAGGLGAVMAGDWISFFVFFEIIALAGAGLIFARRDGASLASGIRYLLFQVAAGVTLLAAIIWQGALTGQWMIAPMSLSGEAHSGYVWLFLVALGLKTGFPLLHVWLVDSYPKASMAGLAVLVAVTTKVGVVGLVRVFAGESSLVPIGLLMALWPVGYVLCENNLRRVLAYSMMVQLGLMVMAIGVGTPLALDGVSWHIVMDVTFKMVFFMAIALIWLHIGTTQADQLSGLAKVMPWVAISVCVAALANIALPLTGGFISKKMMLGAIEHAIDASGYHHGLYWIALSFSVLGLLYAWVRLTWRVFFRPIEGNMRLPKRIALPLSQRIALLLPVLALLVFGMFPALIDQFRPFGSEQAVFTLKNITAQIALLGGAALVYRLASRVGFGLPIQGVNRLWDAHLVYGWLLVRVPKALLAWGQTARGFAVDGLTALLAWMQHPKWPWQRLGQTWPIGAMALWVAVIFFVILVLGITTQ